MDGLMGGPHRVRSLGFKMECLPTSLMEVLWQVLLYGGLMGRQNRHMAPKYTFRGVIFRPMGRQAAIRLFHKTFISKKSYGGLMRKYTTLRKVLWRYHALFVLLLKSSVKIFLVLKQLLRKSLEVEVDK